MIQKPVILGREQRDMVESAISDLCNARGWSLLAVNVRSNHVHAAVRADGVTPEQVLRDMKAQASRRLSDHAGLPPVSDRNGRRKWWAEHGSTIWINDTDRLQEGVRYVSEGQGED
jgi:REP element-mobilizing transposase RayT